MSLYKQKKIDVPRIVPLFQQLNYGSFVWSLSWWKFHILEISYNNVNRCPSTISCSLELDPFILHNCQCQSWVTWASGVFPTLQNYIGWIIEWGSIGQYSKFDSVYHVSRLTQWTTANWSNWVGWGRVARVGTTLNTANGFTGSIFVNLGWSPPVGAHKSDFRWKSMKSCSLKMLSFENSM